MTDEAQCQERIAQTEEVITKEIYINVGVDKYEDKMTEAFPMNFNKKIQVSKSTTRDIGLQIIRFNLNFTKSINTTETMSSNRTFNNVSTITEIDSDMWFNIDQASKKMISLLKTNTMFVGKNLKAKLSAKVPKDNNEDLKSEKS